MKQIRIPALTILLACALATPGPSVLAGSADSGPIWSQWRGPHRDGRVPGPGWPDSLESLSPSWTVPLGKGYPGPIVARDRVFVFETVDRSTVAVRALNRSTGDEIWRVDWQATGSVPFFAQANGDWVRSTPSFDGKTLYVGDMMEVLVALDAATGRERWRVDIPERFGSEIPPFGFASSPLVDEDYLYVQAANSVLKLDKGTGETVWRTLRSPQDMVANGAFSSPIIATLGGKRQLVVLTRLALHGVDLESGAVLWSHAVPNFRGMNILTPTVHGDSVFTSPYKNGSFLYTVRLGSDGFAVEETWNQKASGYMSSPVVIDDHVYIHLGNGRLDCIDLDSGESRWRSKPLGRYWSMAWQGDKILALSESGTLYLLRANPDAFELLDSAEVSGKETWGHLAVDGDEIFVRSLKGITAYRWERAEPGDTGGLAASAH
jgi:outer membrane protein assembly factor BamB